MVRMKFDLVILVLLLKSIALSSAKVRSDCGS